MTVYVGTQTEVNKTVTGTVQIVLQILLTKILGKTIDKFRESDCLMFKVKTSKF